MKIEVLIPAPGQFTILVSLSPGDRMGFGEGAAEIRKVMRTVARMVRVPLIHTVISCLDPSDLGDLCELDYCAEDTHRFNAPEYIG